MRRQDASAQLNELEQRAEKLAAEQHDVENRMKAAFGDPYSAEDTQQQARGLATTQPNASAAALPIGRLP